MLGNNKKNIGFDSNYFTNKSDYDPSYLLILQKAVSLGYTIPSISQQSKQNLFLLSLKLNGIWNKLDVIYVFANNGSKEFATLNWKNPNLNQNTLVNSPTFTINQGFNGDNISSYIDTNFNPDGTGNYVLNNASRYAYLKSSTANKIIDGNTSNTGNSITSFVSALQRINQGGNNLLNSIDFSGIGMKSIHRTSSTNVSCFSGLTLTTSISTSTSLAGVNQTIFRSASAYSNHQISFYAMGASLVSENTDLVSSFSSYLTSL